MGMFNGIFGNINTVQFKSGHGGLEFRQLKSLAASDIEYPVAGLQPVVTYHLLRHGRPAAGHEPVTAVIDAPVAVPVVIPPLLCQFRRPCLGIFRVIDPRQIIALRRLVQRRKKVNVCHVQSLSDTCICS